MKYLLLILLLKCSSTQYSYCEDCKKIQSNLIDIIKVKSHTIFQAANILCNVRGSVKLCKYFVYKFGKLLLNKEKDFLERTNYICANVFGFCPLSYKEFDFENFKKELYNKYPPVQTNPKKSKSFQALVLTDVHVQPDYAYKSKIHCNDPAGCCYENDTPDGPDDEAGYWGQYGCDIPRRTLEQALVQMKHKLTEFVFLLGDNYGHNYFRDRSPDKLWEGNKDFYNQIEKSFQDRIVIPVLGNHEGDPVDHFDFGNKDNDVIKQIYPSFQKFIGNEKVQDLINNGFYDLEFEQYNLKVIALNSQLGDKLNVYNVNKNTNTLNFTQKLAQSLYESEKKGQKVIMISHIAVKSGTLVKNYTQAYQLIIERFKDTIVTLISGHTHEDELQFIKNDKDEYIHCNFIVSSLTTDGNHNPSFRIFDFNEFGEFENYTQYRADLDYYNKYYDLHKQPVLIFDPVYRFKEEYGIQSWNNKKDYEQFIYRFYKDQILQIKYISNRQNQYIDPEWRGKLLQTECGFTAKTDVEYLFCQGQITFDVFDLFFEHSWLEKLK